MVGECEKTWESWLPAAPGSSTHKERPLCSSVCVCKQQRDSSLARRRPWQQIWSAGRHKDRTSKKNKKINPQQGDMSRTVKLWQRAVIKVILRHQRFVFCVKTVGEQEEEKILAGFGSERFVRSRVCWGYSSRCTRRVRFIFKKIFLTEDADCSVSLQDTQFTDKKIHSWSCGRATLDQVWNARNSL